MGMAAHFLSALADLIRFFLPLEVSSVSLGSLEFTETDWLPKGFPEPVLSGFINLT
jgi:hypothetical protein